MVHGVNNASDHNGESADQRGVVSCDPQSEDEADNCYDSASSQDDEFVSAEYSENDDETVTVHESDRQS